MTSAVAVVRQTTAAMRSRNGSSTKAPLGLTGASGLRSSIGEAVCASVFGIETRQNEPRPKRTAQMASKTRMGHVDTTDAAIAAPDTAPSTLADAIGPTNLRLCASVSP